MCKTKYFNSNLCPMCCHVLIAGLGSLPWVKNSGVSYLTSKFDWSNLKMKSQHTKNWFKFASYNYSYTIFLGISTQAYDLVVKASCSALGNMGFGSSRVLILSAAPRPFAWHKVSQRIGTGAWFPWNFPSSICLNSEYILDIHNGKGNIYPSSSILLLHSASNCTITLIEI